MFDKISNRDNFILVTEYDCGMRHFAYGEQIHEAAADSVRCAATMAEYDILVESTSVWQNTGERVFNDGFEMVFKRLTGEHAGITR